MRLMTHHEQLVWDVLAYVVYDSDFVEFLKYTFQLEAGNYCIHSLVEKSHDAFCKVLKMMNDVSLY